MFSIWAQFFQITIVIYSLSSNKPTGVFAWSELIQEDYSSVFVLHMDVFKIILLWISISH